MHEEWRLSGSRQTGFRLLKLFGLQIKYSRLSRGLKRQNMGMGHNLIVPDLSSVPPSSRDPTLGSAISKVIVTTNYAMIIRKLTESQNKHRYQPGNSLTLGIKPSAIHAQDHPTRTTWNPQLDFLQWKAYAEYLHSVFLSIRTLSQ